eukprot:scaffold35085_cov70-Phaeocystis_antarctica.AAC.1
MCRGGAPKDSRRSVLPAAMPSTAVPPATTASPEGSEGRAQGGLGRGGGLDWGGAGGWESTAKWSQGWRGLSACAADTSMQLALFRLADLLSALATAASALFAALAVTAWAAGEASAVLA